MEVGIAEPVEETKKSRKVKTDPSFLRGRRRNGGGGGNNGGGGDGGNNGGDDKRDSREPEQTSQSNPETARVLMWFLLMVVIMTFGALIGAYIVLSTNDSLEWRPTDLPAQVWVSTFLILTSSLSYMVAKKALISKNYRKTRIWLIATTVLGAGFISSQILAWLQLYGMGLYARGNPYVGFFYILTGAHVVHVIGGIAALGYVMLRVWKMNSDSPLRKKKEVEVAAVGLYWHTMDVLWLIILFLLGFWK
ncbi:MAG: cytochrome c oxidase subunit 3 [Pyrinomonadaceae bacterium]